MIFIKKHRMIFSILIHLVISCIFILLAFPNDDLLSFGTNLLLIPLSYSIGTAFFLINRYIFKGQVGNLKITFFAGLITTLGIMIYEISINFSDKMLIDFILIIPGYVIPEIALIFPSNKMRSTLELINKNAEAKTKIRIGKDPGYFK